MTNLEKVEKLRKKADITYEEAKAALESCDWDILDAIVKLEAEGKVKPSSSGEESYAKDTSSPKDASVVEESTDSPQQIVESYQNYQNEQTKKSSGTWSKIKKWVGKILRKSCDNRFVVNSCSLAHNTAFGICMDYPHCSGNRIVFRIQLQLLRS